MKFTEKEVRNMQDNPEKRQRGSECTDVLLRGSCFCYRRAVSAKRIFKVRRCSVKVVLNIGYGNAQDKVRDKVCLLKIDWFSNAFRIPQNNYYFFSIIPLYLQLISPKLSNTQ